MSGITRYDPNYHEEMMEPDVDGRYVRWDCYLDAVKERDALRAELAEIAKLIHYPDCWCDTAYPTLFDALNEIHGADFECSTCWAKKQNEKGES